MSKSWITETQLAGAALAAVVWVFARYHIEVDPAIANLISSLIVAAITIALRWLQKKTDKKRELSASYSDGAKTAEIKELKASVIDLREQMHRAGVKPILKEGVVGE